MAEHLAINVRRHENNMFVHIYVVPLLLVKLFP